MGYSTSRQSLIQMWEAVSELTQKQSKSWEVENPAVAAKLVYKLREALYVASIYPDEFPEIAKLRDHFKLYSRGNKVVAEYLADRKGRALTLADAQRVQKYANWNEATRVSEATEVSDLWLEHRDQLGDRDLRFIGGCYLTEEEIEVLIENLEDGFVSVWSPAKKDLILSRRDPRRDHTYYELHHTEMMEIGQRELARLRGEEVEEQIPEETYTSKPFSIGDLLNAHKADPEELERARLKRQQQSFPSEVNDDD